MAPISVTIEREHPPGVPVTLTAEHDAYSAGRTANEIEVILGARLPVVTQLQSATGRDAHTLSRLR